MKATCRWQYRRIGGANRDGTWTAKLYRSTPLSSRYLIDPWKLNRNDPCLALSICRVLHLGERHGSQGSRTPSAWLARTVPFGWQVCINLDARIRSKMTSASQKTASLVGSHRSIQNAVLCGSRSRSSVPKVELGLERWIQYREICLETPEGLLSLERLHQPQRVRSGLKGG